jgi:hypothetical protein
MLVSLPSLASILASFVVGTGVGPDLIGREKAWKHKYRLDVQPLERPQVCFDLGCEGEGKATCGCELWLTRRRCFE